MALVVADRVQETTTTTGTGTITLAGAVSGFQSFATIGNANTTYYCVTSGTAWEVGIGTYTSAGTTLARTTILASSAAGAAITLAGTSNVFCVYPAAQAVYEDASGIVSGYPISGGSINSTPIGATTASTGAFTTLSASSTVSGTGFSTYLASPPAIGGTAAAAGAFTTLSASSTVSGTGFSTYLASPPAIGGTAAAAGTFTTLIANTSAGIGAIATAGNNFYNAKTITGAASANGNITVTTIQSDVTAAGRGYATLLATAAASFSTTIQHFYAGQSSIGVGSTVTSQIGYYSESNLVGATNNYAFNASNTAAVTAGKTAYGFFSSVNTATGGGTTYGFYAAGTADNVFRGNVYFGNTGVTPTAKIHVAAGSATASTAPLKFTSGTNLTAIEAGVVEYDGTIMSATPNANFKRGTIPITNYTSGVGTSLTAAAEATLQVLLPAANDTITLSIGTYFLDLACTFTRGTVSTTSAQAQINILGTGGAVGSFSGMSLSSPTAGGATANFAFNAVNINVSNVVTAASTTISGVYTITLRGMLKVTTAGTIIPQYNLNANLASAGTATAPNVLYFRLQQIDTQSAAAFGPAGTGWG